jgi:hypothetical protein
MGSLTPDYLEQASTVIRNAENSLQSLMTQAAAVRLYDAAAKLMSGAQAMSKIAAELSNGVGQDDVNTAPNPKVTDYPRFFRSIDNKLIVIGLSPKTRTEYEHKAPKIVLDRLVHTLLEDFPENEGASIEDIKPHISAEEDDSEFPEYYVRSFLRWLRAVGLITKKGHKGYSIKNPDNFKEMVNSYWKRLATR